MYYPILWFHAHKDLGSLRYWYTALQALASAGCRDVMSWSNSSKTLKQGSRLEDICAELTGIPTLEEIYLSTAASHYGQLLNMYHLGFLGPSVRLNKRTNRLAFIGNVQKGRISPLEPLFFSINNLVDSDLTRVKASIKTSSFLQIFEKDKNLNKKFVRTIQKAFSLAAFGLLDTDRSRSKFSAAEIDFIDKNRDLIDSNLNSIRTLCNSRKIYQQHVLKTPLCFTSDSKAVFGNKCKYRKLREQETI